MLTLTHHNGRIIGRLPNSVPLGVFNGEVIMSAEFIIQSNRTLGAELFLVLGSFPGFYFRIGVDAGDCGIVVQKVCTVPVSFAKEHLVSRNARIVSRPKGGILVFVKKTPSVLNQGEKKVRNVSTVAKSFLAKGKMLELTPISCA